MTPPSPQQQPAGTFSSSLQFASHFLSTHTFLFFSCFSSSCDAGLHPSLFFIYIFHLQLISILVLLFPTKKTRTNIKESKSSLVPHGARWAPYYTLSWAHRYVERNTHTLYILSYINTKPVSPQSTDSKQQEFRIFNVRASAGLPGGPAVTGEPFGVFFNVPPSPTAATEKR